MAIKFRKFQPTDYVMAIRNGKIVKRGSGLTLFYNDFYTNILVAPTMAFDGAFAFDDLVTADYQTVCVQGAVTCIIDDYEKAVKMADFGYDRYYRDKQTVAMNLFCTRINNVIKAIVISETGNREVRAIIKQADDMADFLTDALKKDETIATLGVKILAVNILGITAKPETRKALEAAAREEILKEQDDAIYKRRNAAIEQERIIKENELNTEIKVAEKEKDIKEKAQEIKRKLLETELEMEMERQEREQEIKGKVLASELELEKREKEERVKMQQTELEEKIKLEERNKEFVNLEVENAKKRAEEQAFAAAQMVKAYENANVALIEACAMANMDPKTLMAKAFVELGENAGKIGTLNMTPDILQTIAGLNA
jgi:hypothetical protein